MNDPHLSVFTPSHRPTWLDDCFHTLVAQDHEAWEWVVVLVDGARWRPPSYDSRVRVIVRDDLPTGVGAAKAAACAATTGGILVELDHDDMLATTALRRVAAAFAEHPEAALVYSDTAQIAADGGRDDSRWDASHGWDYYEATVDGRHVLALRSLEPTPHNVSYIWYAPNHVRAFRRSAYDAAGGYDASRTVGDDADLMCRLYQQGAFHHIPECLYLQRMHPRNTQRDPAHNAAIQDSTVASYNTHLQANALAWANRAGLAAIDLGSAHGKPDGYLGIDLHEGSNVDIVLDVRGGLPFDDGEIGVIRAVDFLEHIPDRIGLFNEIYRVLAPDGLLLSLTPSTDGRGAFQDPTHVSFYNENAFWYFTDAAYAHYVPEIACRFQVSRLDTYHPSPWHEERQIPYVQANLIAIKDGGHRNGGHLDV